MANPWFRLYTEIIDDEKMRLLAFEDRWHYIAILCCKNAGLLDAGDSQAMLMRKLGVKLGLANRELEAALLRLEEVGLIESSTAQPQGWDGRQFVSDTDPTARDRKRRQRERESMSRVTSVTVTRTDTDTDTEEKKSMSSAAPSDAYAQRLARVTDDACEAFNAASFTKANGGCVPNVSKVGREKRRQHVKRCLKTASQICEENTGDKQVTPEFWKAYFALVAEDDFYSGRQRAGSGHENWTPDFEFLTRDATMLKIYERMVS